MEHRRLGRSGLKVSVLSFGSWVSFGSQLDVGRARDCIEAAHDAGVNFYDNAESYAGGESERIMGEAIAELGWARETYVVSTKLFWGLTEGVNTKNTLNRKYLMHAIDGSLERFGLDFVDLLFCHRADPDTPGAEDQVLVGGPGDVQQGLQHRADGGRSTHLTSNHHPSAPRVGVLRIPFCVRSALRLLFCVLCVLCGRTLP